MSTAPSVTATATATATNEPLPSKLWGGPLTLEELAEVFEAPVCNIVSPIRILSELKCNRVYNPVGYSIRKQVGAIREDGAAAVVGETSG